MTFPGLYLKCCIIEYSGASRVVFTLSKFVISISLISLKVSRSVGELGQTWNSTIIASHHPTNRVRLHFIKSSGEEVICGALGASSRMVGGGYYDQ